MKNALTFLKDQFDSITLADDDSFIGSHESFCARLSSREEDYFNSLGSEERLLWSERFTSLQRRYLGIKESQTMQYILASDPLSKEAVTPQENRLREVMLTAFGRNSYNRVQDLTRILSVDRPRHLVMVGCGALPATLFWLHDHFPGVTSVGLDTDKSLLAQAGQLAHHLKVNGIRFEQADGQHYDYQGVDMVYVANQVAPKRAVLQRIAASIGKAVPVVLRDPAGAGWLLAEAVAPDFPSGFSLVEEGTVSSEFLSRNLFLRFDPGNGIIR